MTGGQDDAQRWIARRGKSVSIELPWPPSMNMYWRAVRGRNILSADGRKFRENAIALCSDVRERFDKPVVVSIALYPPNRLRRDLDNCIKPLLDAVQHAGILADDYLVDALHVERFYVQPPDGAVLMHIAER